LKFALDAVTRVALFGESVAGSREHISYFDYRFGPKAGQRSLPCALNFKRLLGTPFCCLRTPKLANKHTKARKSSGTRRGTNWEMLISDAYGQECVRA
jgi:hypothetical protein